MEEQEQAPNIPEDETPKEEQPPVVAAPPKGKTSFLRSKNTWLFVLGFVGWFGVVWLVWWYFLGGPFDWGEGDVLGLLYLCAGLIILLQVKIFIMLLAIKITRPIAWGMLAAYGLNSILSWLLSGSFWVSIVPSPFFGY